MIPAELRVVSLMSSRSKSPTYPKKKKKKKKKR